MSDQTRRIRDPLHGLIVFHESDPIDMLAWKLIQTPEFQRLRRIRQLGVSEFVFPSATHTRFAHSVGVYHNARKLMEVVKRAEGDKYKERRAAVTLIAALLHDVGHGPFSHAFEGARENLAKKRGGDAIEKHEIFTAKLILADDGGIKPVLDSIDENFSQEIAELISAEDPTDIYHAVVSSSFDADRLDYLMRDRYMTGTHAGSIDYDWLVDNLATYEITVQQDNDEPRLIPTFVFKLKGRQAAEDFLLARYRLYAQVYFHKTTRGFEQLVSALLMQVGIKHADPKLGLVSSHPLMRFLMPGGETLQNYRDLDDTVIWSAVESLRRSEDSEIKDLAERLWKRIPFKVLDVSTEFGQDSDSQLNAERRLDEFAKDKLGKTVFKDAPSYNLYSRSEGEATKAHKMVRILTSDGGWKEITQFPDTVISQSLTKKTKLTRYYFLSFEEKDAALKAGKGR